MLNLLHPALLWLAALAVPLVALYLLKARRQRHDVTAVWLWESVQKDLEARVPLRKLRRDWLLWLQLLVLALLVLAAAGPYRQAILGSGGDVAVVVDASASMLAGERPAELEKTLRGLVDGMGSGDRMTVIRAATRPEVLAPLSRERRDLLAALERARPAAIAADLTTAVELAASLVGDAGSVVVVTDPSGAVPAAGQDDRLRIVRLGTGRRPDNVGVVSLGVRPSDSSGRDHQVFVRLLNASRRPARGTLVLRVDGEVRDAVELEIGAADEVGHTLRLLEGSGQVDTAAPAGTVAEVAWQGDGDALAADDRAFWVVQAPPDRRFRLRGPADPYLLRALVAIVGARSGWRRAGPREAADLEVLVAETPAAEGPPFLWIDPREGRREAVEGAAVLAWERTHPALRFIDLRSVRLGSVYRHVRPPGARVLAESSAGPLILEGTRRERRYLTWAFDPMATDLPLRVAYPLLIRHALEHLVPAAGFLSGGRATGEPPSVPWASTADGGDRDGKDTAATGTTLTSPSGRTVPLTPSDGQLRLPPLEETGVWSLEGEGRGMRFATSLLSAEESDLGPRTEQAGARRTAGGSTEGWTRDTRPQNTLRGLWRPLVLLALALLVLEAFTFHRRWTL